MFEKKLKNGRKKTDNWATLNAEDNVQKKTLKPSACFPEKRDNIESFINFEAKNQLTLICPEKTDI